MKRDEHENARERERSSASRIVSMITDEGRRSLGLARATREREKGVDKWAMRDPGSRDEIKGT